jgi:hypothetical protein
VQRRQVDHLIASDSRQQIADDIRQDIGTGDKVGGIGPLPRMMAETTIPRRP